MKELLNKTVALTRNEKFNGYAKVVQVLSSKIQVRYDSGFEMWIKMAGANGTGYVGVTGNGANWTVTEKQEAPKPEPKPQAPAVSFLLLADEQETTFTGYTGSRWGRSKENPVITVTVNELEIRRLEGELEALGYDEPIDEEMSDGEWTPEGYKRYVDHFYMMRNGEMDSLRARIKELRGH